MPKAGRPQLIWPSVADELQASAERRRLQRDRDERARSRTSMSSGEKKDTPNSSLASCSSSSIRSIKDEKSVKEPKMKKARLSSPDENRPAEPGQKNTTPKGRKTAETALDPAKSDKFGTPKLKQPTLAHFFALSPRNSAPTPIPPNGKRASLPIDLNGSLFATSTPSPSSSSISLASKRKEDERKPKVMLPDKHKEQIKRRLEREKRKRQEEEERMRKMMLKKKKKEVEEERKKKKEEDEQPRKRKSKETDEQHPKSKKGQEVKQHEKSPKKEQQHQGPGPKTTGVVQQNNLACWKQQAPLSAEERAEAERNRVQRFVERLKKALNELDRENFAKHLSFTADRLDQDSIQMIQNPFIHYLIQKEAAKKERDNKIRAIPKEERREFRRNFDQEHATKLTNPDFDLLASAFREGKYEDMVVIPAERRDQFVQLRPVLADRPDLDRHFGRALALTQFIQTHGRFLSKNPRTRQNAAKLLLSMSDGRAGYAQGVEWVLNLLVNFLSNDIKIKPKIVMVRQRSLRSRSIHEKVQKEPDTLEKAKILLVDAVPAKKEEKQQKERKKRQIREESEENDEEEKEPLKNGEENDEEDDEEEEMAETVGLSEALGELEQASIFYELSVEAQLAIFEHFIQRVQSLPSFHQYMEEQGMSELAEAQQQKCGLEQTLSELRQQLAELESKQENVEDLKFLTRKQSADHSSNIKAQKERRADIEVTEQKLADANRRCMILKLSNKLRTVPLGQDRFHRFYWFFAGSPNGQVLLIQQEACTHPQCSTSHQQFAEMKPANNENNEQTEEEFMQRLKDNVEGRPCAGQREERWWHIRTRVEFGALLECLSGRGLREHRLKRQLLAHRELIEANLVEKEKEEEETEEKQTDEKEQDDEGDEKGAEGEETERKGE